jgi:hypothetical protein
LWDKYNYGYVDGGGVVGVGGGMVGVGGGVVGVVEGGNGWVNCSDCVIDCVIEWAMDCVIDCNDCVIEWVMDCAIDCMDCVIDCVIDWDMDCIVDWIVDWIIDCINSIDRSVDADDDIDDENDNDDGDGDGDATEVRCGSEGVKKFGVDIDSGLHGLEDVGVGAMRGDAKTDDICSGLGGLSGTESGLFVVEYRFGSLSWVSWSNVSMRVWIILSVSSWSCPLLGILIPWRRNTWATIKEIGLKAFN